MTPAESNCVSERSLSRPVPIASRRQHLQNGSPYFLIIADSLSPKPAIFKNEWVIVWANKWSHPQTHIQAFSYTCKLASKLTQESKQICMTVLNQWCNDTHIPIDGFNISYWGFLPSKHLKVDLVAWKHTHN